MTRCLSQQIYRGLSAVLLIVVCFVEAQAFSTERVSTSAVSDTASLAAIQVQYEQIRDSLGWSDPLSQQAWLLWEEGALRLADSAALLVVRKEEAFQYFRNGQVTEALTRYKSLLSLASFLGETKEYAKIQYNIGLINYYLGEYPEALIYFDQSIGVFEQCESCERELVAAYQSIAAVYQSKGMYEQTTDYQKRALEITVTPQLLGNIAATLINLQQFDKAETYLRQAMEEAEPDAESREWAGMLVNLGVIKRQREQWAEAQQFTLEAMQVYERLGDLAGVARCQINLADIVFHQGNLAGSNQYAYSALSIYDSLGFQRERGEAYYNLAFNALEGNLYELTRTYLDSCLKIFRALEAGDLLVDAKRVEINLLQETGQIDLANQVLDSMVFYLKEQHDQERESQLALVQSQLDYVQQKHQIADLERDRALQADNIRYQRQLLRRQNLILVLLSLGLIGALIFAYYLNRFNQARKKVNEELSVAKEELETANRELAALNSRLQSSNQQLDQYAHLVSHDLKEPLRMITSFSTLLKTNLGKLNEEQNEYMDYILTGTRRMNEMVSAILSYSKLRGGSFEMEEVNLSQILEQARGNLHTLFQETGGQLNILEVPTIRGNRTMLLQLFQNLMANALNYRQANLRPEITISSKSTGGGWCIDVKDNGEGIPAADLDRIFQLFQRGEGKKYATEGSGIGLATCKAIVEQHQGRITVDSQLGAGSTFHLHFPK